MTAPTVAYVEGRRIHVDTEAHVVTIRTRKHVDRIPFDRIGSKVQLYADLAAKRPDAYTNSLAAARKAAQMVEAHTNPGGGQQ